MNKEQQDKLWSELSEESKEEYRKVYKRCIDQMNTTDISLYYRGQAEAEYGTLYGIFGSHNLNPRPQIKTWKDFLKEFHKETDWSPKNEFIDLPLYGIDDKVKSKIIATTKIAKLIDLGYGGIVTKGEWENKDLFKWYIVIGINGKPVIEGSYENWQEFISFHTKQQAEEFMSHESNRKLVEQYYMM